MMRRLTAILILLAAPAAAEPLVSLADLPAPEAVRLALDACPNYAEGYATDDELAAFQAVYEAETTIGTPRRLRGWTLAAACHESGFRAKARGDWEARNPTIGGTPWASCRGLCAQLCARGEHPGGECRARSVGAFQWAGWVRRAGLTDRTDVLAAGLFLIERVRRQLSRTEAVCKRLDTPEALFVAAWVRAIRYPKPGDNRCDETPRAARRLRAFWDAMATSTASGGEP